MAALVDALADGLALPLVVAVEEGPGDAPREPGPDDGEAGAVGCGPAASEGVTADEADGAGAGADPDGAGAGADPEGAGSGADPEGEGARVEGDAVPVPAGSQDTARSSPRRSPMIRWASSRPAAGRVLATWDRWYSGRFETGMSVVS